MARLNASVEVDIIGHDYIDDPRKLRELVERKAVNRVRVNGDISFALDMLPTSGGISTYP